MESNWHLNSYYLRATMSSRQPTYEELTTALRALANKWTYRARDYSRDSKAADNVENAAYDRGAAESFHKAALELAAVLQGEAGALATGERRAVTDTNTVPAANTGAGSAAVSYASIPIREVVMMLDYAQVNARDITMNPNNVFTAVFSRWQPLSEDERLKKIKAADPRIVIVATGKQRDSGDYFIDFAFKDGG
jgi:hypothetical protein